MADKTLTSAFIEALLFDEQPEEVLLTEEPLNEAFTRQHYEAIAEIFNDALADAEQLDKLESGQYTRQGTVNAVDILEEVVKKIATMFANDNRMFDKGRFLSKCGL